MLIIIIFIFGNARIQIEMLREYVNQLSPLNMKVHTHDGNKLKLQPNNKYRVKSNDHIIFSTFYL